MLQTIGLLITQGRSVVEKLIPKLALQYSREGHSVHDMELLWNCILWTVEKTLLDKWYIEGDTQTLSSLAKGWCFASTLAQY